MIKVFLDNNMKCGIVLNANATHLHLELFLKGFIYYRKKKEIITYAALPMIITVAVAVAGVAEWIFHISNTCGFLLLLVITPLLYKDEG